jgi:hypothetical protein
LPALQNNCHVCCLQESGAKLGSSVVHVPVSCKYSWSAASTANTQTLPLPHAIPQLHLLTIQVLPAPVSGIDSRATDCMPIKHQLHDTSIITPSTHISYTPLFFSHNPTTPPFLHIYTYNTLVQPLLTQCSQSSQPACPLMLLPPGWPSACWAAWPGWLPLQGRL